MCNRTSGMQVTRLPRHPVATEPTAARLNSKTQAHRSQRKEATRCEAARGFGDSASPPAKQTTKGSKAKAKAKRRTERITPDQAVDRAVRIAEGGATRPVNSAEAAKGRLDYVQVKDWGSGKRADLGSLEVDRITTVSGDPLGGDSDRPFYEQLARHLEICQARGDLKPPQGTKPMPPFKKWSFKKRNFLQYLTDLLHVHYALEGATVAALQPHRDDLPQDGDLDMDTIEAYVDPSKLTGAYDTRPCHVLGCFTEGSGLPRAGAIAEDMHIIAQHSSGNLPLELMPSKHAEEYATNLAVTASVAQNEEQGQAVQDEARLRLFANIYSNQVAHLTTGMRIGAAAAERLDLLSIGATNMYQSYPEDMGDPLHMFMGLVNGIGAKLSAQERSIIFEELPGAFYRSSQLLTALARTD